MATGEERGESAVGVVGEKPEVDSRLQWLFVLRTLQVDRERIHRLRYNRCCFSDTLYAELDRKVLSLRLLSIDTVSILSVVDSTHASWPQQKTHVLRFSTKSVNYITTPEIIRGLVVGIEQQVRCVCVSGQQL